MERGSFEDAELLNVTIRNYGFALTESPTPVLTTYAHWLRYNWVGVPENYLPVTVSVELQDASGTVMARIDAEYEVCFYTVREVKRDEQESVLETVLPDFWEEVEPFLSNVLEALRYVGPPIQDAL